MLFMDLFEKVSVLDLELGFKSGDFLEGLAAPFLRLFKAIDVRAGADKPDNFTVRIAKRYGTINVPMILAVGAVKEWGFKRPAVARPDTVPKYLANPLLMIGVQTLEEWGKILAGLVPHVHRDRACF